MAENKRSHDLWRDTLVRGHERDSTRLRGYVIGLAGLIAFAVVAGVGLWYFLKFEAQTPRMVDRRAAVVAVPIEASTQDPSLQPTQNHDHLPDQDLEAMHRHEDAVFQALGWDVDSALHDARPPQAAIDAVIDRAARSEGPSTRSASTMSASTAAPIQRTDEKAVR